MYVVFCKIDHCIHIHWWIVMGLGHNDPWVESHMWPQQTWGQRSYRGQWPLVQVFWKKGQCIHILCIFKSNITIIAKVCDRESRRDSWFENRLVWIYLLYFLYHFVFQTFNITFNPNATSATCVFVSYGLPFYTIYLQFGNLFGLFWISNFFIALTQMTLAGAFASYFWAYDKHTDVPDLPVARSFWWAIRLVWGVCCPSLVLSHQNVGLS